jgi:hypothetical protein
MEFVEAPGCRALRSARLTPRKKESTAVGFALQS